MPRYIITKRIEAPDMATALSNEKKAQLVEITDIDDPEVDSVSMGFSDCG